jgi:tetratricopeptide (TPR) repeat protein
LSSARVTAVVVALLLASNESQPQTQDVSQRLEEAKALLREARVTEAIQKLQSAVAMLERQRGLRSRRAEVADACLELGFSYLRLGDRAAAREAFQSALLLERTRRLDPQIYAPAVVTLFEEARLAVERSSGR